MKRRTAFFFAITVVAGSLAACGIRGDQPTTEPVQKSTVAQTTMIATITATTSPTLPSTPTLEQDNQITKIATSTRLATSPATPTNTPTNPAEDNTPSHPTITPTVPPAPNTPDLTPSAPSLINYFRTDVEETDPGESIILSWGTTNAMTVTLWHLAATGQFSEFWPVPANGDFEYQVASHERNRTTFALSAIDEQGHTEMASVAVNLRCPDEWFFTNHPDICPANAPVASPAAEQLFEHGIMIWFEAEERIYVLYDDGRQYAWQVYNDTWTEGDPDRDPAIDAPAGFYQPVRGFGKVWREQPEVRNRLGWATGEEIAYDSTVQRTSYAKYNETYIKGLAGSVWRLKAERSGWEQIPSEKAE